MMCGSESIGYSTFGIAVPSVVLGKNGTESTQLRPWGGGIVAERRDPAGPVTMCPHCRACVPLAAVHAPACPVLRDLASYAHAPLEPRCRPALASCADELRRLADTARALARSGWYRRRVDWQAASRLLQHAAPGAFLVRDSGDARHIFSLSVQTECGPTSVRIHYECGGFRLDCSPGLVRYMPSFGCVVELVQHYVTSAPRAADGTVWVNAAGCPHAPVGLRAGLRAQPPSLAHAARLAVHRALAADKITPRLSTAPRHRLLPLPRTLIDYLEQYPYCC